MPASGEAKILLAARRGFSRLEGVVKPRGIVLVGIVALVALAAVFRAVLRPAEPDYKGKRLSEWLRRLEYIGEGGPPPEVEEAIREIGVEALPFLVKKLGATDPSWKQALWRFATELGLMSRSPKWAWETRGSAIQAFAILGPVAEPAIPQIGLMLTKAEIAGAAVAALASIGQGAVPTLITALTNRNSLCRAEIAMELGSIRGDGKPRVSALVGCLHDPDSSVREAAVESLARLSVEPELVVAALLPVLNDRDSRMRTVAASALGNLKCDPSTVVPALLSLLDDQDRNVRASAATALGHLKHDPDRVVPALLSLFDDRERKVRISAAIALGKLGSHSETVVPALMSLLSVNDPSLKDAAINSLGAFGSKAAPAILALVKEVENRSLELDLELAARALSHIDLQAALAAMGRNLQSTNPETRFITARVLGNWDWRAASLVPILRQLLEEDTWPSTVQASRQALERIEQSWRKRYGLSQFQTWQGAVIRGRTDAKRIALVFTGHAYAEGGETILDELAKHQAKASFFFTGEFMTNANFEPLIRRIVNGSHLLGPHSDKHLLYCSWNEDRTTLVTQEDFSSDLAANRRKIAGAIDRLSERKQVEVRWPVGMIEAHKQRYGTDPAWVPMIRVPTCNFFLPPYEHYNQQIADWTAELGMTLINYTPGTRSNADYTGEADKNFVSSQAIFDSILKKEREDPKGLNGFILLLHIGAGPGRADKFHTRFGELLDVLAAKGYQFVRVDELLEPRQTP